MPEPIATTRLNLVPASVELLKLELDDPAALAARLGAAVPASWPPAELRAVLPLIAERAEHGWQTWYWVARRGANGEDGPILVGSALVKGPPDAAGAIEVGYGTAEEHQRRGYATEAVGALTDWAARQPGVARVTADASPANPASLRVLARCGFVAVGPGAEPGDVRFERPDAPASAPSQTIRYAHTNLIADDWRALADFYERNFGCIPVSSERDHQGPAFEALTAIPGARLRGRHLRLPGHGPGGPTLEIFQYDRHAPAGTRTLDRPGLAHLAFEVADVESTRLAILAAGGRDVGRVVTIDIPGAGRLTLVYLTDPEGNILELQRWHPAGDSTQGPD